MKESMIDVLMYIFDNYLDEEILFNQNQDSLKSELQQAGFPRQNVNQAFDWLESLAVQQEQSEATELGKRLPMRIYTPAEQRKLGAEGQGFLLFLEYAGALDMLTREIVIDRCMALDDEDLSLDQIKWVALMVLFNQPGHESDYTWMEDLVYNHVPGSFH